MLRLLKHHHSLVKPTFPLNLEMIGKNRRRPRTWLKPRFCEYQKGGLCSHCVKACLFELLLMLEFAFLGLLLGRNSFSTQPGDQTALLGTVLTLSIGTKMLLRNSEFVRGWIAVILNTLTRSMLLDGCFDVR